MSNPYTEYATARGVANTSQPMVLGRITRDGGTMLMVRMPDGRVDYIPDIPGLDVGSPVPTTSSEMLLAGDEDTISPVSMLDVVSLAGDEDTISPVSISTGGTLSGRDQARELARRIAVEEGVDPDLFERLVQQESSFRPDVVSSAGAIGYAQLMPDTAAELGVDPWDPEQNLRGGARYLRQQFDRFGDTRLALAAYNAGPGKVREYGGVPPFRETQDYVRILMGEEDDYRRMQPTSSTMGAMTAPPPARPDRPEELEDQQEARSWFDMLTEDLPEALQYLDLQAQADSRARTPEIQRAPTPLGTHRPRSGQSGTQALQRLGIGSLA